MLMVSMETINANSKLILLRDFEFNIHNTAVLDTQIEASLPCALNVCTISLTGVAEVSFEVSYLSASSNDLLITPSSGSVTLENGQNETTITLQVVDDDTPEESEELRVNLISTSGDAVLVTPTAATVTILPSNDPNGVFEFAANSTDLTAEEGDILHIT